MNLTLDIARDALKIPAGQTGSIPLTSVLAVTTPGAAAGWIDTVERFGSGKLTMEQILEPAIRLCDEGFPVSEVSARLVGTHIHTEFGSI
jgi:gamma-glutamyltranspeptidase/glutathione hydrolase